MEAPVMKLLDEKHKTEIRKDLYEHVQGVTGVTDLNIQGKPREGFISAIKGGEGGQPKEGYFISKLLSKRQDYVGRGTIIPEPTLGIDEMAMPEPMAWKLFEPFVVKELRNHGKTPVQALDEIKQKSPLARRALEIVMEKRHVMLNRAPSLHKFSIMAFKPKITDGKSIKIQPLVNKGFNADFDGDEQLTTILTFVPDSGISALDETICMSRLEESDMTARFREIVGLKDSAGDFYMFNLENFPHTDLIGTKEGKKGRIDFYKVPEGIKVLSYDPDSKKVSWKDVFGWSKHYQREIEIVTLRSGRQIVTDDDPRAVYGICAGELEPRRFTPNEAVNSKVLIPLMIRGENSLYGKKEIFEGVKLSHKLGHLIGSVVSNGWVETCNGSFTGRIFIACVSEPCGEFFLKTAKEVFNFPGKELRYIRDEGGDCTYGPSKKWGFLQDDAARLLYKMVGLGARNKHLPPFFLTANKDFRNGLFAGLMDHDGTICISHAKGKKAQLMASYSTASIRLAQELQWLAKSLGIRSRITTSKTPAGEPFWYVSFSNVDIKSWNGEGMLNEKKLLALNSSEVSCSDLAPSSAKSDVVPIHRETAAELRKRLGAPRNAPAEQKSTYVTISNAISDGYISRISALKILETFHSSLLEGLPHIESWRKVVENTDVTWDPVESFERTGIKEDGYDLTVPGYETFVNIEGVVLSNTMTVHVPITDEANEEARKMLPSRNLYQPGNKALMIIPSQEALLGLYYLSQTDAGRKRLASILGPKYPITMTLGKKNILGLLRAVAEGEPENYGTIIQKLKEEGERHVYDTGMTVGINDIPDFSPESKKIIAGAKKVIAASKDFASTNKDVQNVVDEFLKKKLEGKDNPLYDQVASGAKGSPSQLRSIMVSPLFVADQKGRVIPTPISKPYAAGLTTADYWMASYGVRKGMMDTAIQTSLPGAFSKDIMATTLDNVISKADCGTKDGIVIPVTSNEVIDRYTAGEQAGVPHNTLVDVRLATKLKSQGVNAIKVRSPLKCLAPKGTCAHCYGLDEHGHLPEIGENVGAKSGQTISEPLTQLIMNSKHTGGVAGTGASVGGYQRISQLLSLPKVLTGSAALAPVSGKITKIVKGIAGGFDAYIGDTKVHIPQGRKPLVEAGQHVEKGDVLSDGPIKPQELTELRGVEHAQNYLTDELHQTYKDQGVGINRKTFETVVRSLTNTTQVTKPPAGSNWLPGDVIPLTVANHYNQSLVEEIDAHDAVGMRLANGVGSLKVGHILTAQEANSLASNGVNTVTVAKEPLEHKPFVKGMQMLPIMKHDWMAALGYRNISKVLQEGASQGWKTDLESYHPVPPMAYAATFGQGKEGKY
jgi:intein/homing endonuclease